MLVDASLPSEGLKEFKLRILWAQNLFNVCPYEGELRLQTIRI